MNGVHIKRVGNGYDGGGSVHIGRSSVTFSGHIDRQEIERLRGMLQQAESWIQTNGTAIDTSGPDFLSVVNQGAGMLGQLANSPVGDAVATFGGPYGAVAVAAARGSAPAIQALTKVLGPSAATVAALSHPDPAIQAKARPVVNAIAKDDAAGVPGARVARLNLAAAMVKHKDMLLAERAQTIAMLKDRLALLGDPLSYADTSGPDDPIFYGFGSEEAPGSYQGSDYYDTGAAAPAGRTFSALHERLDRALGREPQPTFRHRRPSFLGG